MRYRYCDGSFCHNLYKTDPVKATELHGAGCGCEGLHEDCDICNHEEACPPCKVVKAIITEDGQTIKMRKK